MSRQKASKWRPAILRPCALLPQSCPLSLTALRARGPSIRCGCPRSSIARRAANVPVRLYYARPLHEQAALRHADCWHGATPVADRLARTVLSLPMGPYLTEEDQRQVVAAFAGILERGGA